MKKMIIMAAMMVATLTASAQTDPGTFSIVPHIGVTASQMTNTPNLGIEGVDGSISKKYTLGILIGAEAAYQVNDWISLAAGLNFAQAGSGWKNAKVTGAGITTEINDLKILTNYINIPLTANFYIWQGLAVKTGIQCGFLLSAKSKGSMTTRGAGGKDIADNTEDFDNDIKDSFNKFDLSIPIGLSYEFSNNLVIDARYNFGITRVNKDKEENGKDTRNSVFSLTLGYKFEL